METSICKKEEWERTVTLYTAAPSLHLYMAIQPIYFNAELYTPYTKHQHYCQLMDPLTGRS